MRKNRNSNGFKPFLTTLEHRATPTTFQPIAPSPGTIVIGPPVGSGWLTGLGSDESWSGADDGGDWSRTICVNNVETAN